MKFFLWGCFFCSALAAASLEPTEVPFLPILMPEVLVLGNSKASLTIADFYDQQQTLTESSAGAVGVVNADSYKTGRSSTLKDALDFAAGVYVQPRFGQEESRISLRGSGIQRATCGGEGIQLLQDGMPINRSDGSFNMQSIEPLATRYIEVYRGANSLQYGSTSLGGAINFVTFTGYNAAPLDMRFEYGSYDTFRGQVSSGMVLGKYDYYTSLTTSSTDGYRDHSEQSSFRLFSNVGAKLLEALETRFYFTYVKALSQIPGPLTKEELQQNPRQAYPENTLNNWQKNYNFLRIANKTAWEEDENRIELQAFWDNVPLDDIMSMYMKDLINDLGVSLQWKNKTSLCEHENHFTLGFNPTYGFAQDLQYNNTGGQIDGEDSNNEQYALNLNVFMQDQFYLTDKLSLVGGSALTYARRQNVARWVSDDAMNMGMDMSVMDVAAPMDRSAMNIGSMNMGSSSNMNGTESYWGWSPQLGWLYDITKSAQVFGNVSRSFSPPSFMQLVDQNYSGIMPLQAETATTLETGTRGRAGRYRWDLAYYYSWVENEFLPYSVMTPTGPSSLTVNAGQTIHQGVEMELGTTLFDGVWLSKRLSESSLLKKEFPENGRDRLYLKQVGLWNNFYFNNNPTYGNNALPGIPPFYYRAELLYEHPCGFYVGPNVEMVPVGYNVDAAGTLKTDPYALLGFKIGYRPKHGFSVYLQAMNLSNTTYAATTGIIANAKAANANLAQFFPGDGISFYGGVEYTW
jgi:iron complex outermembrane receptor protein